MSWDIFVLRIRIILFFSITALSANSGGSRDVKSTKLWASIPNVYNLRCIFHLITFNLGQVPNEVLSRFLNGFMRLYISNDDLITMESWINIMRPSSRTVATLGLLDKSPRRPAGARCKLNQGWFVNRSWRLLGNSCFRRSTCAPLSASLVKFAFSSPLSTFKRYR